jgi:hypothetical protein
VGWDAALEDVAAVAAVARPPASDGGGGSGDPWLARWRKRRELRQVGADSLH